MEEILVCFNPENSSPPPSNFVLHSNSGSRLGYLGFAISVSSPVLIQVEKSPVHYCCCDYKRMFREASIARNFSEMPAVSAIVTKY
jgi:hypothetical protein